MEVVIKWEKGSMGGLVNKELAKRNTALENKRKARKTAQVYTLAILLG